MQLKQRLKLLADISSALNKTLGIHWLCYGTLWGVIRGNRLLEYDKDGDICTTNIPQDRLEKSKCRWWGQKNSLHQPWLENGARVGLEWSTGSEQTTYIEQTISNEVQILFKLVRGFWLCLWDLCGVDNGVPQLPQA